jgi:catalase
MRQTINKGKTAHSPNGMSGGCPFQAGMMQGGFTSFPEKIEASKIRERSKSFFDHFSQAKLFFNSQSDPEKNHITDALCFELGKVELIPIRERMLYFLSQIDEGLAAAVAYSIGLHIPKALETPLNQTVPADADPERYASIVKEGSLDRSKALSMAFTPKDSVKTRKIAILAADGVNEDNLMKVKDALTAEGALCDVIAPKLGFIAGVNDTNIPVAKSFLTSASVFYDAVYVPGGINSVATLEAEPDAVHFLNEAFKHCKAIAFDTDALQVIKATYFGRKLPEDNSNETVLMEGIITGDNANKLAKQFIAAIAQHRFWEREKPRKIPA